MSKKHPGGRPSAYRDEYAQQAAKLCRLGASDSDLADFFNVNVSTIKRWSSRYEEFCAALKGGKDESDERVERSLYQRAMGYEYDAVKVFQVNGEPLIVPYRAVAVPDTTACIFWLKNRRPDRWRDVHKHEHGGPNAFDQMSDDELREYIAEETKAMRMAGMSTNGSGNGTKH